LYKYFTFASASGGCCPPDLLPGLYPWASLGELHPQTTWLGPLLENMWIHVWAIHCSILGTPVACTNWK